MDGKLLHGQTPMRSGPRLPRDTLWTLASLALVVTFAAVSVPAVAGADVTPPPSPPTSLQDEKLRQEIRKLRIESDQAQSPYTRVLGAASFLVAVAGFATLAFSWKKQREESARQRDADRRQREDEKRRTFDESFALTIQNLSAESLSLRANAAVTLLLYVGPRYRDFVEHMLLLSVTNLRLPQEVIVRDMLVRVLERAVRLAVSNGPGTMSQLDFSGAQLHGLDLSDVDLRQFDVHLDSVIMPTGTLDRANLWKVVGRGAELSGLSAVAANLGQARMDHAQLDGSRLDGARLTSADLRGCDLQHATFRGSQLQSTHFDGADLRGARFEGANLADTYFLGARLDAVAIQSLRRAQNWRKAHFDDAVRSQLMRPSEAADVPAAPGHADG